MATPGYPGVRTAVLGLAAFAAMGGAGRAAPPDKGPAATRVVYVLSNNPIPGRNAILAYRSNAVDGSLTPLPGSPFLTRGTGTPNPTEMLGPEDADQQVIVSADHRLLFATNSGSDTIAVFRIASDGSLAHVKDSPFPSGGVEPSSLGLSGDKLYVVNKGDQAPGQAVGGTPPNYTGFRVNGDAQLIPITKSTVVVRPGSQPTQALISPDGSLLFGIDLFSVPFPLPPGFPPFVPPFASVLQSFQIQPNGRLVQAPGTPQGLPPAAGAPFALGLQAHPTQRILYVGFVFGNRVGVYRYDASGRLTFVTSAANSGLALCWIAINRAGTFLYTSNSTDDSLSVFDSSNPLAPFEIQHLPLKGSGPPLPFPGATIFGTTPFTLTLDPTGRFLYVVNHETAGGTNPSGNAVHILKVGPDGKLTEPAYSPVLLPVPAVANPVGVVAL